MIDVNRFGRGYIPDPNGLPRVPFRAHPASRKDVASLNKSGGPIDFAPPIMDQGGTGACMGHREVTCTYTSFGAAGHKLDFVPSPALPYKGSRDFERVSVHVPLTDNGTTASAMRLFVTRYGLKPMGALASDGRFSDADPATINNELTLVELESAATFIPIDDYQIAIDDDAPDNVAKALDAGNAVGVAVFVDTAFMQWTPNKPPCDASDMRDPDGGGHGISIVKYEILASGEIVFTIQNSWGVGAGDGGRWLVSSNFIMSAYDLTAYSSKVMAP